MEWWHEAVRIEATERKSETVYGQVRPADIGRLAAGAATPSTA
jgi:hypothetical protein